jgi:transcriptional regulator with XRE-family HTH domain
MITATPARRRFVGMALRRYRQVAGLTLDEAARILECDRSKVSRIETGQRGIRSRELRELLTEYDADKQVQDTLVAVAHPSAGNGWWRPYRDMLSPASVDFAIMEAAASRILIYETQHVPVLLQTRAYAEAAANPSVDAETREKLATAVAARQVAIFREQRPEIAIILGEAVLHQQIGEVRVMRGQLQSLARIMTVEEINVQVLPFTAGISIGTGVMAILEFAGDPDLGIVVIGSPAGGICLPGEDDLAVHRAAWARMTRAAFTPAESASFLCERAACDGAGSRHWAAAGTRSATSPSHGSSGQSHPA